MALDLPLSDASDAGSRVTHQQSEEQAGPFDAIAAETGGKEN
jgi:hypothetical protein